MTSFRYEALTPAGEPISGEMEAPSPQAVIRELQNSGYLPIGAREIGGGHWRELLRRELVRRRASAYELGVSTQELATFLKAGLPLDRALELLAELAPSRSLAKLLEGVLGRVRGGASLADAIAAQGTAFPPLYVNMVRAGELGGALEQTLARLAEFLLTAYATRESVKSAMVYPAILLFIAGLALVIVLTVVLPQFKPLFDEAGAALPVSTRIVMAAGEVVGRWWWVAVLVSLIAVAAFRRAVALPPVALVWHRVLLRLPLFGPLIAKLETARFARTLGTLVANGVPLPSALGLGSETISNRAMAAALQEVGTRLKEGEGLAQPLARTNLFPRLATHLMRVGEETGRLEEMLINVAQVFDREVQRTTERLLALLTPALTIGLGLIIAAIIASVLAALLSVNELAV